LPDGTIGGFPSWIADSTTSSNFTVGPAMTSAVALTELRKLLDSLLSNFQRGNASLKEMRREDTNASEKTPETTQMNLTFCDSKPMILPDDKQRELTIALADLLLNAATKPAGPDSRGDA
jgi:hypothetical protein